MAYFEITGSGTGAYDGEKEGIWFKHDTVDNLVFTKLENNLKITGQLDEVDFEYTITNYDFSSLAYNGLFKGETEASSLDSITNYQIKYTADSDFTKSAYNWDIFVAEGTDEEHYTIISVSGFGAGDTLNLDADIKSKTWSDDDKNKLVVTDNTGFKRVTITDYFSNPVNAYYPPSGNLDVTLACDTPYTPENGFTESIHGVGKISAVHIGTENSDQLVIGGTVTYVREYEHLDSLFVRGTNGDNIEVTDFSFDDADNDNIYVNGVQTSAATQIDITLPSDSTFHGSAYKDNITIESNPDPYYHEYTTNVTIDGLASGDILNIQNFNPGTDGGWYCNRDMSAENVLTITNADVNDPILTINDYGTTRGTFTFIGLNPANCHLYVTNANSFDAGLVSDTWGFEDFAIEGTVGSDTLKGGSGIDSFNGHGGHDIFIFEGDFGQDIVQESTAQDEFHFVGIKRSKISYNEGQFLNNISIEGTDNTITFQGEVAAPDIIYAVNEAGAFQKYSLQGTFKTAFDVPADGLTEDVTISDSNYNAINFLNADFDISGLTFERTANTLIVSGITEDKTITITDFNFNSLSNIDNLQVMGSYRNRISDCRITYDLSENYTKAFASPYKEDITVTNNTTANISGLKSTDTLTLDGTKTRTWSEDAAADKNKLVITNTENNITVAITDYFLRNHDYYPESGELNVTLNDTTNAYACTSFDEVITGKGIVSDATEADILYMGNQCDDVATCVGNDVTFTNGENISITIQGFLNNAGELTFAGNLCIDGSSYKGKYEHVAYNDKNVAMSGRTYFDNSENLFASVNITGTNGNDTYIGGAGDEVIESGAGNDSIITGTGMCAVDAGDGNDIIVINGDVGVTGGAGDDSIIINNGSEAQMLIYTDEVIGKDTITGTNESTWLYMASEDEHGDIIGHDIDKLMFYKKEDDLHVYTKLDGEDIPIEDDYITVKDFFTEESQQRPLNTVWAKYFDKDKGDYDIDYFDIKRELYINHDSTNNFNGTDYMDVVNLDTGLTTATEIENLSEDTDGKVIKNEQTGRYTYTSDFDGTTTINLDAYAQGRDNDDIIYGSEGSDYIDGGDGDDSLDGGEGDDILVANEYDIIEGGKGNDTVIIKGDYNDIKVADEDDGFSELIIGASVTQRLHLTEYAPADMSFALLEEVVGDDTYKSLAITTNKDEFNNGTVIIRGYFDVTDPDARFDKIVTSESHDEYDVFSIRESVVFDVTLAQGETYDKENSIYKGLRVNVSLENNATSANVTGLGSGDNINIGEGYALSRTSTNSTTLTITKDDVTINITNFDFSAVPEFTIAGAESITALDVTASTDYTATDAFVETITVDDVAVITNLGDDDKLYTVGAKTFAKNGDSLEIKDNNGDTLATISDIADHHGFSISSDGSNYSVITSKALTVNETSFDGSEGWNGFTQFDITGTSTDISGTLKGGVNRDFIKAGAAGDIIWGNGGNDVITGGEGEDKLYYEGNFGQDRVNNLTSDDMIYFTDTARADISFVDDGLNKILRKGDELDGNEITIANYKTSEDKFDIFYAQNEAGIQQAYSLTGKVAFDVSEGGLTEDVTISNNSYYLGLNFAQGTDIGDLTFTRTNDGLQVSGGTLGQYTITISDFDYLAADVTTNVNTLTVNGESIGTIAEQLINYEISGDYEKPAENLYHERITVADSTNAVISGLDGNDRLDVNGVNSRTWSEYYKDKLVVTDTTNSITVTITDYFTENADHTYYPESGELKVTLDYANIPYEFTSFTEIIGGNGVVSANNLQTTGTDRIQTTGENVYYARVNNDSNLIIYAKNGDLRTDNITVWDFNFDGEHDININDTTTANMQIDVILEDNCAYTATSYAEIITGNGSVTGATNKTIIYMGEDVEDDAVCVGNDVTFAYRYEDDDDLYHITINGFIDNDGNFAYNGKCYVDGDNIDNRYEQLAYDDINLDVSGRTTFNNIYMGETLFHSVNIIGTDGNDSYTGGEGDDIFNAAKGNDTINFVGDDFGDDTVTANSQETLNLNIDGNYTKEISGDDVILTLNGSTVTLKDFAKEDIGATVIANGTNLGEAEYDVKMTSAHYTGKWLNENITGTDAENIIDAKDGNDTVDGGAGDDIIFGGAGNDSIIGGAGNDSIIGGSGNDTISGSIGNDTIFGGTGNDVLDGYNGLNKIVAGELTTQETPGAINIGNDEYVLFNTDGVSIDGGKGLDDYDTIYAGGSENTVNNICGKGGNDEIHLYGGKNNIILPYSTTTLENFGVDTVYGATENDTLYFGNDKGTIIGYSFSQLSFERYNTTDLVVYKDSKNKNAVIIKDFFNPENMDSRIDKVVTREYKDYSYQLVEHSIKNEATMTIGLNSNELFVKSDALDGYKLNVVFNAEYYQNRSASVRGLQDCDQVNFDGVTTLTADGNALTFTYKSKGIGGTKNLTVLDFFDENSEFNHNIAYWEQYGKVVFANKDITVSNSTKFSNENNYFKSVKITGTDNNDTYKGGNGNDEFNTGNGNDVIYTGNGSDYIDGGDGDDTIYVNGYGNKIIYGGNGNNTFFFDKGSAVIKDTHAGDIIKFATFDFSKIEFARGEGNNINDLLIKSKVEGDNDAIVISNYFVQAENDRISTFNIQGTEYTLGWRESSVPGVGSAMYNIISNSDPNPKFIDEWRNWVAGENGTGVEVSGRKEYDMLSGTSHSDTISAGINGAEIYGSGGDDVLYGSDKDDYIVGGAGNDKIYVDNDRFDADTISFINKASLEPLSFGNDIIYGADIMTTLNFAIDMGEEAETRYVGYNATNDLKFEKSGTSLLIKARKNTNEDYNIVEIRDYFDKKGKVVSGSVDEIIALNGNNQLSSYSIEALRSTKYINLSHYNFEDLTFERDMTGGNINNLVIKHNTDGVVWEEKNFFKQKNPVDLLLTLNDTISIKKEIDIIVKTDGQNYTGNDYREVVSSSNANEKYNLKTNKDNIILSGNFGKDEVTLNNNEDLTLTFDDVDNIKKYVLRKDVILEDINNSDNQVILKDFAVKNFKNSNIYIKNRNEESYEYKLNDAYFDPAIDGSKITGTKLNEAYTSTSADERIDLKAGNDDVFYDKDSITDDGHGLIGWGNDKITINKNECLGIYIAEKYTITKDTDYIYDIKNEYKASGKDLVIVSTATCANPPEGYAKEYNLGTITIVGGLNINSSTEIYVNDVDLSFGYIDYETGEIITALHYNESDVTKSGVINGGQLSDGVDLTNYISEKGTGVKVDTKGGSDVIIGSKYNDTLKSTAGNNRIEEYAGKNTITVGSGDDQISVAGTSSNTINAGEGSNWIWLTSSGINKATAGNGDNYIYATNGYNTIKAGNGGNLVRLQGGINTVTTGTGRDEIIVSDPSLTGAQSVNNIRTGNGADIVTVDTMSENIINTGNGGKNNYGEIVGNKITLTNGINTVTSGKDADKIIVSGGQNIINAGAGNDNITMSGGINIVNGGAGNDEFTIAGGINTLNGAAGNDIYKVDLTNENGFDFTNGDICVTDITGVNVLDLSVDNPDSVKLFFDIELKKDKKGNVISKKGNNTYTYSAMTFTTENIDEDINGVDVINNKAISKVKINGEECDISTKQKKKDIAEFAQEVANWLYNIDEGRDFVSTSDAFGRATETQLEELVAQYTTFSDQFFNV